MSSCPTGITEHISIDGISRAEAYRLIHASAEELAWLFHRASSIRSRRSGRTISYSRKIFIPLTNLCRDTCGYCTFARPPHDPKAHTMTPGEVLALAEAGRRAGCKEALFSLGERPELRYPSYREWLTSQGYGSTIEYLAAMCRLVFERTGLLPHSNPGTLNASEIEMLRPCNASMGMMLESASERLLRPGEAHHACPDKIPRTRLATLEAAGRLRVPFTTGILIGIGETPEERVDALFAIRDVHAEYGHIQEVIIQNFRAKDDTRFAGRTEPSALDVARTAAVARLIFGSSISLQIPPNLTPDAYGFFLLAGIDDWGGISPVTLDCINPEKRWPELRTLQRVTAEAGFELRERLAVYPHVVRDDRMPDGSAFIPERFRPKIQAWTDESGLVRREEEKW